MSEKHLIIAVSYSVPNVNLKIMECKMFYKNKISLYTY